MTMTPLAPSAPPTGSGANSATRDDYLRSRWDDALVARMDPVERLIYRSNILGADARITNTGGGNTSSKISVNDPLTGETTRVVYGDDVIWTDWQRPGFELGLELERVCREHPNAKGAIMGQHGLINWANDDKECYELTLELIRRAQEFLDARGGTRDFGGAKVQSLAESERKRVLVELLPWLRGKVSAEKRQIATVEIREEVLEFVNSNDAPRLAELGTSCPDHFLRTKIKPLYADWNPSGGDVASLKKVLDAGLTQYRADYAEYYDQCKRPDSPAIRVSSPSVILVPGLGLIAFGKSKSESRVTAEFYNAAIGVMRGAERVSKYIALDRQEAFAIENLLLEEAKPQRMPAEKTPDRRVRVVVRARRGIRPGERSRSFDEG